MRTLKMALAVAGVALATQAAAQITLYDGEGFRGPAVSADKAIYDFDPFGFNDRAQSLVVSGGTWQVCEDAQFQGRCVVLQPGNYDSLRSMGMNERISSVRPVGSVTCPALPSRFRGRGEACRLGWPRRGSPGPPQPSCSGRAEHVRAASAMPCSH